MEFGIRDVRLALCSAILLDLLILWAKKTVGRRCLQSSSSNCHFQRSPCHLHQNECLSLFRCSLRYSRPSVLLVKNLPDTFPVRSRFTSLGDLTVNIHQQGLPLSSKTAVSFQPPVTPKHRSLPMGLVIQLNQSSTSIMYRLASALRVGFFANTLLNAINLVCLFGGFSRHIGFVSSVHVFSAFK